MDAYTQFFLNSTSDIVAYDCIELSHPNFSAVYRFVRNNSNGITVVLESGVTVTFDYVPMKIEQSGSSDDLDQTMRIDFGDLGEQLPQELDRVRKADNFLIKPTMVYRVYRSDNLSLMHGPIVLEVSTVPSTKQGATINARAPRLNVNGTGETYTVDKFPMLGGYQ